MMSGKANRIFVKQKFFNIIQQIKQSSFIKNFIVVMTGTALAQVVGFALSPVISRLYSPADFGVFGSFTAVLQVISAGVTLQYNQALMLPKEKDDAFILFILSCLCTVFVSFLLLLHWLVVPSVLKALIKWDNFWVLPLLILATGFSGFNQSFHAWSVRVKAFNKTAASQVIRSCSSSGAKIGFGLLRIETPGLIISLVFAEMVACINLIKVAIPDIREKMTSVKWSILKKFAYNYRDFPLYAATQNVINALSLGMPVLLLTQFFNVAVAGAYSFAFTILHVPMGFVLTALKQVLFQKVAETYNQGGDLSKLYIKTTVCLFCIAILPSAIILIWATHIFTLVFGSQWYTAGEIAKSLVVWNVFAFCNLPAAQFGRILRVQRFIFLYDIFLLSLRTIVLVVGGMYLSAIQTITYFALIGAFMNAFLIIRIGKIVIKSERNIRF